MISLALMIAAMLATPSSAADGPAAPAPALHYAFSIHASLLAPIEQGTIDGRRKRFVPIAGGTVSGPRLAGEVLPGGGDWQAIDADGVTEINTRYSLRTSDGVVIDIQNPGVRVASPEITAKMARGEPVAPDAYYFRTTPRMSVAPGAYDWLRKTVFIGRGIRTPDQVVIDVYAVD